MGARNADRIWLFAGAVVILLLVVASYLLVIRPKYTAASEVRVQVEDTQTQLVTLRRKIADLDKQRAQLPKFKAALAVSRLALPSGPGLSDFLRQLQRAGDQVEISVTGISVSAPVKSTIAPDVWELPITLNAEGDADKLSLFLTKLQTAQARAVLVRSATFLAGSTSSAADTKLPSISLAITAYVAPPAGTGVPIVTTK
jgi:type IV pilus assembly protein PilO